MTAPRRARLQLEPPVRHDGPALPDYYGADAYPNNTLPRGRVIRATKGGRPLAGYELVAELQDARLGRRLEGYLVDAVEERGDGSTVVTARAKDPANSDVVITAARGVVVATGGKIRGLEPDADDDATRRQLRPRRARLSYNARGEFHLDRVVDNDGESSVEDDAARSQLFLVYGDAAKATYLPHRLADTIATNVSRAGDAIAGAPWFSLGALADDFGANLRDTLDTFNAAASGDGDDPFERGVPGTTAYESSIAWWQFAFAYLGAAAPETIGYGGSALTQPFAGDGASTRLYVRPLNFGSIDTKFGPATFGATTAGVDDVVEVFGNDTAAWLAEQMALPPTSHRAYFRRRALPAFAGACDASEAATDPALGNPRYGWYYGADDRGRGVAFHDDLEFPHDEELGKGMVFTNIALHARTSSASAFSPVMAVYLTYLGSRQFDGVDQYPDENYAREFMQLFTIGLRELRDDQRDDGAPTGYETYDNDDIATHARAWTGFDVAPLRSNVEAKRAANYVDDLRVHADRRDPFPKRDLYGGYIGDRRPRCADLDPLGGVFVRQGRRERRHAAPLSNRTLYAALCAETDGACAFPRPWRSRRKSTARSRPPRRPGRGPALGGAVYESRRPRASPSRSTSGVRATDALGRALCADRAAPAWRAAGATIDEESPCATKVQVHKTGAVNLVHDPASDDAFLADSDRLFRVAWAGAHPTADGGCGGCTARGVTCVCDTEATAAAAFDGIPAWDDALATLHVGSPVGDPATHEGYALYGEVDGVAAYVKLASCPGWCESSSQPDEVTCAMSACMECHFCGVLSGLALDEEAVFSLTDEVGTAIHLKNVVETVDVAGGLYAFRNAPHFVPFGLAGAEDLGRRGGPRMVTSNPSPRYVAAVADAFRSGAYDGRTCSGAYGDIGAAVAAALSDREARSATILADPTHGRLREPLLKVLHFARAMELSPTGGREVSLEGMDQKIGQMAHEAPSVFSYYLPDYSPQGAVGDRGLVAPEAQVLTGTQMIGLLNGLHSLIDHGLSRCASGFGGETGSCQWPAAGGLAFAPADGAAAAAASSTCLTEGRLSAGSRAVVEAAYGAATNPAAALRAAQERMVLAPDQCENSNRLGEVPRVPGPAADMPFDVTDDYLLIEPREDTQPCGTFGMHPSLANVHGLYEDGDAA
ncbi:hypothetical protein JL721_9990 [Aureococcus anophagefferens]|nr:hypothetical protein JL721_9990 [Aureococcus anophagefferens]